MKNGSIRVGFIGLNPDSHWAATAHLPALKALGERYEIVGAANSSPESSQRTAKALGLRHAFVNAQELVTSPEVDLVVVTVKVPHHLELVTAALEAGKHVYCEWPLGNGLAEARQLAALAAAKGVVAVAGTQARAAIEVEHLRRLIADGYVGTVLSTTLVGSGGNWAGECIADHAYLFDSANGATMQAIPLAHTLAALQDVLGPIDDVSARFISRFDKVKVSETGESLPKNAPDQVMIHGALASGAALSVHYRGGQSRGTNLLWEINGTSGDIQVTAGSGHAQMAPLTIRGAQGDAEELELLMPPASAYDGWPDSSIARNVARMYARMADDIQHGTRTAPSFEDAVALHQVLDNIERSAAASHP
ncbi:MAG: Gfo/Idh/MocA family oxidoreductase [Verrucomicrobiota bacterium JB022]|nr:Gfo/Idh/MocA family oxidoreductase [Verrucomicrobiota bacterium JB022]